MKGTDNMNKLEIYTGTKTYMYPTGKLATPEVLEHDYPALASSFKMVITTDAGGEVVQGIGALSSLRSRYDIDAAISDEEALAKIEEAMNAVPEPEPEPEDTEPSAVERIAAALEYQSLASMPDEEV